MYDEPLSKNFDMMVMLQLIMKKIDETSQYLEASVNWKIDETNMKNINKNIEPIINKKMDETRKNIEASINQKMMEVDKRLREEIKKQVRMLMIFIQS